MHFRPKTGSPGRAEMDGEGDLQERPDLKQFDASSKTCGGKQTISRTEVTENRYEQQGRKKKTTHTYRQLSQDLKRQRFN